MDEKKISKTEQRKLDAANKKDFIGNTFLAVMTAVAKKSADVTGGPKVQLTFTNGNRYVRFNAYGMSAAILIFRDGNVEVQLTEFCHSPHKEQLFEFSLDQEKQKEFLKSFKKTLTWFIPECFGKGISDFHTFMDYVSSTERIDEAHEEMVKEWKDRR